MKVVHYSTELESEFLGHLMHKGTHDDLAVQKAMLKLSGKTFYIPLNAITFGMIRAEFQRQEPFDFVSILSLVGKDKLDLYNHISDIMSYYQAINVSGKLSYQLERLLNMEKARTNCQLAEVALNQAYEHANPVDANAVLAEAAKQICEMECVDFSVGRTQEELYDDVLTGKAEKARIIPTTSMQFNALLGGGVRSKGLITAAGTAGVGKTGLAIWLLDIISRSQPHRHSLFFSLEMEPVEIFTRRLGIRAGKPFNKLGMADVTEAAADVLNYPMRVFDYKSNDLDTILTTSRLMAIEKPISVIVVDYLTLVSNRGNFERNDLRQADTTTKLARLAIELDCIVIALSQVNRSPAGREDQCPMPQDAADSSGSHRSSTLWLGIDRPELYNDEPWMKDQFVIKCRKNRFGKNFEYLLSFNEGTFIEVDLSHFRKPMKQEKGTEEIYRGLK